MLQNNVQISVFTIITNDILTKNNIKNENVSSRTITEVMHPELGQFSVA